MLELTKTGIRTQSAEEIIKEIQQIFVDTFGPNVNLDPNSINGQLIVEIANFVLKNDLKYLKMFNNFNLEFAPGVWLDAIGNLFLLKRIQGTRSEAQILIKGLSGLEIPADFEVTDGKNIWYAPQMYLVDNVTTMRFLSKEIGPVAADADTINQELTAINGIESLTNPSPAVLGTLEESDFDFRRRIKTAQSINSVGQISSLESELTLISKNFIILENHSNEELETRGVKIAPHSIFLCIEHGSKSQVARALYAKKSLGCGMTGDVEYTLRFLSGQEFTARFNRPNLMPIKIKMAIKNTASQPYNFVSMAKKTILTFFGSIAKIGVDLYSSEFIQQVANAGISDILSCSLSLKSDNIDKSNIAFTAKEFPTLAEGDIEIAVT